MNVLVLGGYGNLAPASAKHWRAPANPPADRWPQCQQAQALADTVGHHTQGGAGPQSPRPGTAAQGPDIGLAIHTAGPFRHRPTALYRPQRRPAAITLTWPTDGGLCDFRQPCTARFQLQGRTAVTVPARFQHCLQPWWMPCAAAGSIHTIDTCIALAQRAPARRSNAGRS